MNSSIQILLNEIEAAQTFKSYHQNSQGKGLFGVVKNNFEEMVIQLKKFVPKSRNDNVSDICDFLLAGKKIWAYYEFKMFAWIVSWQQFQKKDDINNNIEERISFIHNIFPNKCELFLKYEYLLLISKTEKSKCLWTNVQVDSFLAVLKEFQELMPKDKICMNWKFISFRLFAGYGNFKTPNQCRERWSNHLNPKLRKTKWDRAEDLQLVLAYQKYGPRWAVLSRKLQNRTQHMVKNRFNSLRNKWLKKKKTSIIFNISLLIRDLKANAQEQNQQLQKFQKQGISEIIAHHQDANEMNNEEGMIKPIAKQAISSECCIFQDYENSSQQISESGESRKSFNIRPALLSLADVGGEIELNKPLASDRHVEELHNQRHQYEMLLNDTIWKNNDRVPTSDFEWLQGMMEERNLRELEEYL